jgi:hypothetical protein
MKKLITSIAILSASAAMATEVSVDTVRDLGATQNGTKVSVALAPVSGFKPVIAFTKIANVYDRYAVGAEYSLTKYVAVTGSGFMQNTVLADNGYGLSLGLKSVYPLTKSVDVTGSIERSFGQARIQDSNTIALGVTAKF